MKDYASKWCACWLFAGLWACDGDPPVQDAREGAPEAGVASTPDATRTTPDGQASDGGAPNATPPDAAPPDAAPPPETCDGLDDDGDGEIDEDIAAVGEPCWVATTLGGFTVCAYDRLMCRAEPVAQFLFINRIVGEVADVILPAGRYNQPGTSRHTGLLVIEPGARISSAPDAVWHLDETARVEATGADFIDASFVVGPSASLSLRDCTSVAEDDEIWLVEGAIDASDFDVEARVEVAGGARFARGVVHTIHVGPTGSADLAEVTARWLSVQGRAHFEDGVARGGLVTGELIIERSELGGINVSGAAHTDLSDNTISGVVRYANADDLGAQVFRRNSLSRAAELRVGFSHFAAGASGFADLQWIDDEAGERVVHVEGTPSVDTPITPRFDATQFVLHGSAQRAPVEGDFALADVTVASNTALVGSFSAERSVIRALVRVPDGALARFVDVEVEGLVVEGESGSRVEAVRSVLPAMSLAGEAHLQDCRVASARLPVMSFSGASLDLIGTRLTSLDERRRAPGVVLWVGQDAGWIHTEGLEMDMDADDNAIQWPIEQAHPGAHDIGLISYLRDTPDFPVRMEGVGTGDTLLGDVPTGGASVWLQAQLMNADVETVPGTRFGGSLVLDLASLHLSPGVQWGVATRVRTGSSVHADGAEFVGRDPTGSIAATDADVTIAGGTLQDFSLFMGDLTSLTVTDATITRTEHGPSTIFSLWHSDSVARIERTSFINSGPQLGTIAIDTTGPMTVVGSRFEGFQRAIVGDDRTEVLDTEFVECADEVVRR